VQCRPPPPGRVKAACLGRIYFHPTRRCIFMAQAGLRPFLRGNSIGPSGYWGQDEFILLCTTTVCSLLLSADLLSGLGLGSVLVLCRLPSCLFPFPAQDTPPSIYGMVMTPDMIIHSHLTPAQARDIYCLSMSGTSHVLAHLPLLQFNSPPHHAISCSLRFPLFHACYYSWLSARATKHFQDLPPP